MKISNFKFQISNAEFKGTVPVILMVSLIVCPVIAYCQPISAESKEKAGERVWKKDPFALPDTNEAQVSGKEELTALEVSAILYSGERSSAVINGKTVHIGDELNGHKVLDIKRTYVILGRGNKSYKLELKR